MIYYEKNEFFSNRYNIATTNEMKENDQLSYTIIGHDSYRYYYISGYHLDKNAKYYQFSNSGTIYIKEITDDFFGDVFICSPEGAMTENVVLLDSEKNVIETY